MFKKGKWLLVLLALVGAVALLAACAAPTEEVASGVATPVPKRGTPSPDETPVPGGIYRLSYTSDWSYWSPLMGIAIAGSYNRISAPLLQYNFGPGAERWSFDISSNSLAESWEISADGLTYTFHLHKGMKWQNIPPMNGREFVADDVKWSLGQHMTTAGAPRREMLNASIKSIECPDKYTVVIQMKVGDADFLQLLASTFVPMLPREAAEEFGTLNKREAIIGVGPFILDEYVPNVRYVYKKNPTYYRANEGLPYLDGIYYTNIADASTSLAAFRSEKIDWRSISRVDVSSVLETNPDVYCYEGDPLLSGGSVIVFRTDKLPFSDVNLRRAVSMAIDRQAYIDSQLLGYGLLQVGPIHAATPWYLGNPVKDPAAWGECLKYEQYNPEEARRLIAEAGYPGGLTVTLHHSSGSETAELVNDFLTKAGFKVVMAPLESTAFYSRLYSKHDYDELGVLTKWGGGTIGPNTWLGQFYLKGYASNYSNVDDPVMKTMIEAQAGEMDPVKRQQLLNDIQRYEICQKYYVHLPQSWYLGCMQPWVRGYWRHAADSHSGRIEEHIWLTEDAPGRKK